MFCRLFSRAHRSPYDTTTKTIIQWRGNSDLAFYEPPYLEHLKPKTPAYEAITVQIKGYDFPLLENFQRFAHGIAQYLNFKVDIRWAHPGRHYNIKKYKPRSTNVDYSYKLIMYERDIKLLNVPALKLPLYAEIIQSALPDGTQLNIFPFDEEHFKERYVPDHELNTKMKELEALGGPPMGEKDDDLISRFDPKPGSS